MRLHRRRNVRQYRGHNVPGPDARLCHCTGQAGYAVVVLGIVKPAVAVDKCLPFGMNLLGPVQVRKWCQGNEIRFAPLESGFIFKPAHQVTVSSVNSA